MNRILMCLAFALCLLAQPRQSLAVGNFELTASLGGNYAFLVNDPNNSKRIGLNLEVLGSYKLFIVSFDLAALFGFLKVQTMIRPGVRLRLGWFYLRLAVPFAFSHLAASSEQFNIGLLGGVGLCFAIKKKWLIQVEANVTPFFIEIDKRGVLLPAELRLGFGYRF